MKILICTLLVILGVAWLLVNDADHNAAQNERVARNLKLATGGHQQPLQDSTCQEVRNLRQEEATRAGR